MDSTTHGDPFIDVDLKEGDAAGSPLSREAVMARVRSLRLHAALADVADCRAKLAALGEPPDHEAVEQARDAIHALDAALSSQLERLAFLPPNQAQLSQNEELLREATRVAKLPHEDIIHADELYRSYERLLRNAEEEMVKLSSSEIDVSGPVSENSDEEGEAGGKGNQKEEEAGVRESLIIEVSRLLAAVDRGELVDQVKLNGRDIANLPNSLFSLVAMVSLDLSYNKLEVLSDSVGNLVNLRSLNLEKNRLEVLPDSIGMLRNLEHLNVSENKLAVLPESIVMCRKLVSLKANLNQLSYLPSQLGFNLLNLQELAVQWNKLRTLSASVCNLKSLKYLYVNFNQLKALPSALGNLSNLEVLDASCNFMDLKTLPDTIGDLTSLVELNLRCNQIRALPDSFGRLRSLKKVDLKENPLMIPPPEVVSDGVDAILAFMQERWRNRLEEEQQRLDEENQQQSKWQSWTAAGSWLTRVFTGGHSLASNTQSGQKENYLEQQL